MILALDTYASYLSKPNARSRAVAYYFLTRKDRLDFNNRAIDIISTVIKHVMSSALKAKTGALYYGHKKAIPYRVTLEEMGHAQPGPTPVTTNNNIVHGLTMGTMNSKASKSNDMRFQWLKCREVQRLFKFLWERGVHNRADCPSKHYPGAHHLSVRPQYVVNSVLPQ